MEKAIIDCALALRKNSLISIKFVQTKRAEPRLNLKRFIHIKVGNSSSDLSHLFYQAYNSAQLFPSDPSFKEHVRQLLPTNKQSIISPEDNNSEYEIVIAIVDKSDRSVYDSIPFFSKISLNNISQRIRSMGYRLSLLKIGVEIVDKL